MTRSQLIAAIEAFAASKALAPATVTSRAVGNSRLYERLKRGGDCTLEIAGKVNSYIETHSVSEQQPQQTGAQS